MSVSKNQERRKQMGKRLRSEVWGRFSGIKLQDDCVLDEVHICPIRSVWKGGRSSYGVPDNYEIIVKAGRENVSFSVELFNGKLKYVVEPKNEKSSFTDLSKALAYGRSFIKKYESSWNRRRAEPCK